MCWFVLNVQKSKSNIRNTDRTHQSDNQGEVLTSTFKKFIYLAVLGLCCYAGFSLAVTSGGYSLVAVHGLIMVVAALVAEHRL